MLPRRIIPPDLTARAVFIAIALTLSLVIGSSAGRAETGKSAKATLRVVLDNRYPPFVFLDDEGKLQGILVDQWRLWERKTGVHVELTGMDWSEALRRMREGEFDVIDTIFRNEEREKFFDFTAPYQSIDVRIFFRSEISGIVDLPSLRGFPVGVKAGDDAVSLLRRGGVQTLVEFNSYEAILTAAQERKISVFVVDGPPGRYFLSKFGLERQCRESQPIKVGEFHRAVAKGDAATLRQVEAGFASIAREDLQAIETKWCGEYAVGPRERRWVVVAILVGLLSVVLVLVRYLPMRRAMKKQTEALVASEQRFQSIYNSVSDAVFIHDAATGRVLDVNNRMCEMYGCTVEEARRSTPADLGLGEPPYGLEEAMARLKKAQAGTPQVFEWRCRRTDKSLFWGEVRMRRARVGDQDVIVASVSDISERKRAEMELQEATERFHLLSDNSEEVFWITSADRKKALYVSPAYEKIWGCSRQSFYDAPNSWVELIELEDRSRVMHLLREKQLQGGYTETYRIRRPDGQQRWIFDRAWPVRNSTGEPYRLVGIMTDITDRRVLEMKVNHAQKMEAIGTLAGGIAHDFNNILGAITGYTELAKLDSHESPVQASLDEVLCGCKRASDLVGQILAFSRQQDHKRTYVHLENVVGEATRLLRAVLPSTLEVSIQLSPTTPTVLADPSQIHQIIMNLCTNAVHAMEGRSGSRLSVKLEMFVADESFIRAHPGARAGRYALVSVSDNGRGMDRNTSERIFEPFYTTKAPGKGTGLGLAVVHGIVQRHDGLITVDSAPDRGTTFRIYFPEQARNHGTENVTEAPVPPGRGQRILVVDDEEPLVRVAGKILSKLGYESEGFLDPIEALKAFEASPDRFDLVITDLTMPGSTGLDLASSIRRVKPNLPIILMTGYYSTLAEKQLSTSGVSEVLLKPVDITSLGVSIYRVLQNQRTNLHG